MSVAENNLLVVDPDDDFVSRAKELFDGRLPVARTIEEALSTVESGAVRMILLARPSTRKPTWTRSEASTTPTRPWC